MKKYVLLLLSAALVFSMTACGKKSGEVPATATPGVLKVGIVDGNDRFASNAAGAPVGIEADVAKLTAREANCTLQYEFCDNTNDLMEGLQNGQFDIGFGRVAETDKRTDDFTLSSGYGKGGLFLVTPKNNYMDCIGIMQTGTLGVSVLVEPLKDQVEGAGDIESRTYSNISELRDDIASGTILAGLVCEREAVGMINSSVQAQELINSPRENYVALMPKGSSLKSAVDAAIGEYKLNGAPDEETEDQ